MSWFSRNSPEDMHKVGVMLNSPEKLGRFIFKLNSYRIKFIRKHVNTKYYTDYEGTILKDCSGNPILTASKWGHGRDPESRWEPYVTEEQKKRILLYLLETVREQDEEANKKRELKMAKERSELDECLNSLGI